jgi:hypothetical protein
VKEEIAPDAEKKETEINLAENGDCGVFAIALLRNLLDAGIDDAELMIIGDPSTYEGEGDSPGFEDFYNIDIFHIAVFYDGKYYDVNGRTTPETMLGDFVPYGGEGITPADYSPAYGRDFLSESFVVGSREYLDNTLEGFVEATTNVQTSVENYSARAKQVAEEIIGQQKENIQNTLRQMIKEETENIKK